MIQSNYAGILGDFIEYKTLPLAFPPTWLGLFLEGMAK